jgi:thiamine-phosphate pyrophosphorylase
MSAAEPAPGARRVEPRLIAITARAVAGAGETLRRFERLARAARPHTVMFQLRDRELSARERLTFGRELGALCRAEQQWFQVNDRCDLAALLEADALHLGEASVAVADARRIVGASMFVSRACHAPDAALETGVSAWVLSPIFAERKGRGALGLDALAQCARRHEEPRVFALGGVTAENAAECLRRGAQGVAVIGAVLAVPEPEPLLDALGIRASV